VRRLLGPRPRTRRPRPRAGGWFSVMASANLDLVRSIFAAVERGDVSSAEWAHPEIEYVIADGPSPGTWTGLAGMAEGTRDYLGSWEDFRAEVDAYRQLDDDRVLVLTRRI